MASGSDCSSSWPNRVGLRVKPEFPIWTSDSRIVRFSCSRHNEFVTRAADPWKASSDPINEMFRHATDQIPEAEFPRTLTIGEFTISLTMSEE